MNKKLQEINNKVKELKDNSPQYIEGRGLALRDGETLTEYQKALFIVLGMSESPTIDLETATHIYKEFSCQTVRNGVISRRHWMYNSRTEWRPLTPEEVNKRVVTHLMNNLGALIVKGYISVIPRLDFEAVKKIHTKEEVEDLTK